MSVNFLKVHSLVYRKQTFEKLNKCYLSSKVGEESSRFKGDILAELEVEDVPKFAVEEKLDTEEIDKLRNKSRLNPEHERILAGQKPYDESMHWSHDTVWYKKRIMGRYGIEAAGVNPAIAWPTKEEIEDRMEYERVLYPRSIEELWKEIEEKKKEKALKIKQREQEIDEVVAKFETWKAALNAKIEKKEAALLEAKKKKERMLAEIREEFGYYIDTKDERFQEMLAKKEKEDKKRKKEEKKQKKAEKLAEMLAKQAAEMLENKSSEKKETKENLANNEIKLQPDKSKNEDEK